MDLITLAMAKAYADKQSKAYIKRTEEVLLPETTEKFIEALGFPGAYSLEPLDIADGDTLSVIWDGVQYNCTVAWEDDLLMFGNQNIINDTENTGEPFAYTTTNGIGLFVSVNEGTHTFSVIRYTEIIDPKYLPAGIGGGNSINFAKDYGSAGEVLNGTILELAMGGGGVVTFEQDADALWADIVAKQPTQMVLNTGLDVRISVDILCADEATSASDWFISGSGALLAYGTNLKVTCILSATNEGSGVTISVLSEPITFPSTT